MAEVQGFEDLHCWQSARCLFREFYQVARSVGLDRDRILFDQMRRAALSVGSNVAEGFERGTRRQQIQFCFVAKGSAAEFRSQLTMAHDVGLIGDRDFRMLRERAVECSKLLAGYLRWLQKSSSGMPRMEYGKDA